MKRFGRIWVILSILFVTNSFAQEADTLNSPELIKQARDFIGLLSNGSFEQATANFDSTMKAMMPPDKLQDSWNSVVKEVGLLKTQGNSHLQKVRQYEVIAITCQFEKSPLDIKLTFDPAKHIAGLFFAPTSAQTKYEPPSYVNSSSFKESHRQIGVDEWAIPGTLSIPNGPGPFPAVILIHGSGPNDRDETIGPNRPFADISGGLASKGIAVLRYDKRTMVHGAKMAALRDSITVNEEVIDDALKAVDMMRHTVGIDSSRVFILGHSLGGMLAPRIASDNESSGSKIAGLIIMAGNERPLEDLIVYQYEYIFSLDSSNADKKNAELEKIRQQVKRVKDPNLSPATPSSELPLGVSAKYWLDLRGYDPAKVAAVLPQPILILQGRRDYQVTSADFDLWKSKLSTRKNVEFKYYPGLNHLFMAGNGMSTPQEYQKFGHVSGDVVNDITEWINRH